MTRSENIALSEAEIKEAILEWYKKKFKLEGEVDVTISIDHEVRVQGMGAMESDRNIYRAYIHRDIKS